MFKKNTVQNRIPVGMDFLVGYSVQAWSLIDSSQIYMKPFLKGQNLRSCMVQVMERESFFCSTSKMST